VNRKNTSKCFCHVVRTKPSRFW